MWVWHCIDSIVYKSHRAAPSKMEEEDGLTQDEYEGIDEECEKKVGVIPVIYPEGL